MATIRTSGLPANFRVKPHVQAFADAVQEKFGLTSFGTYASHEPVPEQATDVFVTRAQGDALAEWATQPAIMRQYGIQYCMWWHRIKNIERINEGDHGWRNVADRGGPTQNHEDHNHFSFYATAPAAPAGSPPIPQEDPQDMIVIFNKKDQGFLLSGGKLILLAGDQAKALENAGVPRKDLSNADVDALYRLNA